MSTAPGPPAPREPRPSGGRRLLQVGGAMVAIVLVLVLVAVWAAGNG